MTNSPAQLLSGKRVLVTGGTGFIGGRLVERLISQCGASVRVALRSYSRATRIARFPVELVQTDLTDAADVRRAVDGCDVVMHCACGTDGDERSQRQVTHTGTVNILEAAAGRAGPKPRVVHVSTINVYGNVPDGDLDESRPRQYAGDVYSDSKLDAENAALQFARERGLPVAVIQPTIVYGPFGPAWTTRIFGELEAGRVILVNGGQGLCNAVYVDDVVSALTLAAVRDEAVGEAFLISAAEPVTWRQFYGAYEEILGSPSHIEMSAADAERHFKEQTRKKSLLAESMAILRDEVQMRRRVRGTREVDALMRTAKKMVPPGMRQALKKRLTGNNFGPAAGLPAGPAAEGSGDAKPILPLAPGAIRLQASKIRVRIDKARRLLGYEPQHDFASGMRLTGAWARWANLAPDPDAAASPR